MGYDSRAATSEPASLFGCAGQQSDNGWRSLVEPAVPLGFLNAVRGGWRGSSAFISTFRDAHSRWPDELDCLSLLLFSAVLFFPTPNFLSQFSLVSHSSPAFPFFSICFSSHFYSRKNWVLSDFSDAVLFCFLFLFCFFFCMCCFHCLLKVKFKYQYFYLVLLLYTPLQHKLPRSWWSNVHVSVTIYELPPLAKEEKSGLVK